MTDGNNPEPGTVAFLRSGIGFHTMTNGQHLAYVSKYGQEIEVTPDLIDVGRDRRGRLPAWLRLLDDAEGQRAHFGEVVVMRGRFPKHLPASEPGSPEFESERRTAARQAQEIEDPDERRDALRHIEETYGTAVPTSRSLARYSDKR